MKSHLKNASRFALVALVLSASLCAQTPDIVRGPYLQLNTPTEIFVQWRTDLQVHGRVFYGSSPDDLSSFEDEVWPGTNHIIKLTGLTPSTRYYYAVATQSETGVNGDPGHYFVTSPLPGTPEPTRIWVLGDCGTANGNQYSVRDAYYDFAGTESTDLILLLGDNAYPSGTDAQYQNAIFNVYDEILKTTPMWSTFGNHDSYSASGTNGTGPYFNIFTFPDGGQAGGLASGTEAYYSFDYGNVHFVSLDSQHNDRSPTGAMAQWLQADLQNTLQEWVVVFFHHGPYTKGSHDSDVESRHIDMRQNLLPIMEAEGVDLVLSGHSHSYERSMLVDGHYGHSSTFDAASHALDTGDGRRDGDGAYKKASHGVNGHEGAVFVVAGSSGKISGGPLNHPVMVENLNKLGSVVIDVNGSQMDVRFLDNLGNFHDDFSILKGGVTPVDRNHTILADGEDWKFHDQGQDLGVTWCLNAYDDTDWPNGNSVLGYGESFIVTQVSPGVPGNHNPTTYFRKVFDLDIDPSTVYDLKLLMKYDDGFVAYLNGVEVARANIVGTPTYGTFASVEHEGTSWEAFNISAFREMLMPQGNLLAIEVHNQTPSSGDLVMDALMVTEAFVPHLPLAPARGTVGVASGPAADVLLLNDSAGGNGRSVDVLIGDPIDVRMAQPNTSFPGSHYFLVCGRFGTPGASDVVDLPGDLGAMCFAPPGMATGNDADLTFVLTDSFGGPGYLGSMPAPWTALMTPGIIGAVEITFQGVIAEFPGQLAVTNAVRVNVVP